MAASPAARPTEGACLRLAASGPKATARLAGRLAAARPPAWATIHLCGEVGAGKSVFARALIRALGVSGSIPSPSFSLVQVYRRGRIEIGHFDFYRCADPNEWRAAGLDETLAGLDIAIVEWPQKAAGLPPADIEIWIGPGASDSGRILVARAFGARNEKWLCKAWR